MSNPFELLGIHSKFYSKPTLQTATEYLHEPSSPIIHIASQYDNMVTRVLAQLVEIAYPNYGIRHHSKKPKNRYYSEFDSHPVWSIGIEIFSPFTETGRTESIRELCIHWEYGVAVVLGLNPANEPILFECVRGGYYWTEPQTKDHRKNCEILKEIPHIQCQLSEEELIKALIQLHPEWTSREIQEARFYGKDKTKW